MKVNSTSTETAVIGREQFEPTRDVTDNDTGTGVAIVRSPARAAT
jgi:hypothetical protein